MVVIFFSSLVQQMQQKKCSKDLSNQWSTNYSSTSVIRVDDIFSVYLLPEKVQITEGLNIKAYITLSGGCFEVWRGGGNFLEVVLKMLVCFVFFVQKYLSKKSNK